MGKFTGKNRNIAKWLGEDPEGFVDPGFCLGCGEANCECDNTEEDDADFNEEDFGDGV